MTKGSVDSASIHSALAALSLRYGEAISAWDRQSLLDTTYLLLFQEIGIVPGPGGYRGASGLLEHVIIRLPRLEKADFRRGRALQATKAWLTRRPDSLRTAWNDLQTRPEFPAWAGMQRDLFWLHHVRMHVSLFNAEFIPHISALLGRPERELERIQVMSRQERTVRQWLKANLKGEDAQVANDSWLASALIRGRFHEYVASASGLHLSAHSFRKSVERTLPSGTGQPIFNSEEYFVRVIIGSSLLETTDDRRAKAWADNIAKARAAIEGGRIALPNAALDSDAERLAAEAALACGISASYSRVRRELEVATTLGIAGLLTLSVSPWLAPLGPIATAAYRQYRGASVGEDLARFLVDTKRRFFRLTRTVPGRITRFLKARADPVRDV